MARTDDDGWLKAGGSDPAEVAAYYDRWAARYDADLSDWSYRAPAMVARLITEHAPDATSILDAGCGTGLSGSALRTAGYAGDLHGIDLSELSLAIAGATGAYTTVTTGNLQEPLEFADATFDAVSCVGVMTYVPDVERCWRDLCRVVVAGGVVAITQRSDLWEPRSCAEVVERLVSAGVWSPIWVSDPEPYLPGNDDFADEIGVRYVAARVA